MEVTRYSKKTVKTYPKYLGKEEDFQKSLARYLDLSEIKEDIKVLKVKHETDPNFFTIVGYASLLGKQINLEFAKKLGREASKICRDKNIELHTIPDPRFGRVKTYPKSILEKLIQ